MYAKDFRKILQVLCKPPNMHYLQKMAYSIREIYIPHSNEYNFKSSLEMTIYIIAFLSIKFVYMVCEGSFELLYSSIAVRINEFKIINKVNIDNKQLTSSDSDIFVLLDIEW